MTGTLSVQEAALRAENDPLCCGFVRQVTENVFYWKRAGSGFSRIFRQDAASVSGKWETYYIKERMDTAAEDVAQDCSEAVRAAQRVEHAAWEQHRSLCNQTVVAPQFCSLSRLKLPAPDAVMCSCAHACCLNHRRSFLGKQALSSPRCYRQQKMWCTTQVLTDEAVRQFLRGRSMQAFGQRGRMLWRVQISSIWPSSSNKRFWPTEHRLDRFRRNTRTASRSRIGRTSSEHTEGRLPEACRTLTCGLHSTQVTCSVMPSVLTGSSVFSRKHSTAPTGSSAPEVKSKDTIRRRRTSAAPPPAALVAGAPSFPPRPRPLWRAPPPSSKTR